MIRIAILASHGGTILQAVLDACASRELNAQVVLVISNNSNSGAMQRAQAAGVATAHLSSATHPNPEDLDAAMARALRAAGTDWVLLAGYMKKLGATVRNAYRERIINTHPALLPKFGGEGFYGRRVHEAVLAAGETETGATLHLVDAHYDSGPILAQVRVPVRPDDDAAALEERVKVAERKLVVATLAELAQPPAAANS
ncbi:MAG: phosphoribosylglycinamide formyltransferase [Gammaproteobacteria bacterium]|nr:phosphoribosylglycinamide formyltransferase [Gammaproteobacteria bacterium]